MNTSISGSCFIQTQAAMLRLFLGLFLFGLAVEIHAAQPETGLFADRLDLLTIQLAHYDNIPHYDNVRVADYRFSARVGIAGTADNSSGGFGVHGTSRVPGYINLVKEPFWVTSIRWHLDTDGNRASLSPNLRLESKETFFVIKPIDHSVWMVWHRLLD
ncbi:MAG: hypothetical protein WCA63_05295 [Gallionella sp.]